MIQADNTSSREERNLIGGNIHPTPPPFFSLKYDYKSEPLLNIRLSVFFREVHTKWSSRDSVISRNKLAAGNFPLPGHPASDFIIGFLRYWKHRVCVCRSKLLYRGMHSRSSWIADDELS
ncbi:hypothetical protein CEXT_332951 [Caerostris extrusa]|uniref:Uncharacterized protein n=1 Tax=Caerostris extrusa TaxID=172846 RepID=A0AAV4S4M7_CAEEX|nr:hypothetical protein CEXT_332951 [Caerostris extrusa]